MNTGAIAVRYAKALLKLVDETGHGDRVCAQVREILAAPDNMPSELEPELCRLVELVSSNRRESFLKLILHSFVSLYERANGIRTARLTTAVASPELEDRIREVLKDCKLNFQTKVDPDLMGGFVLVVDDLMMDASVRHQLDMIREQFIERNRRIV